MKIIILNRKFLSLFFVLIIAYSIYLLVRPSVIVDIHNDGYKSDILVKHLPKSKAGKIAWWEKNKEIIKEKYNIPRPNNDGYYHITIWSFGDGYQVEKPENGFLDFPSHSSDHLKCFKDMDTEKNCIEKNDRLEISESNSFKINYF